MFVYVCVCACVYAPSATEISSIFAWSPNCLGGFIVDESIPGVPGLMENSSHLHCLELEAASGAGKLLNTIALSR